MQRIYSTTDIAVRDFLVNYFSDGGGMFKEITQNGFTYYEVYVFSSVHKDNINKGFQLAYSVIGK